MFKIIFWKKENTNLYFYFSRYIYIKNMSILFWNYKNLVKEESHRQCHKQKDSDWILFKPPY